MKGGMATGTIGGAGAGRSTAMAGRGPVSVSRGPEGGRISVSFSSRSMFKDLGSLKNTSPAINKNAFTGRKSEYARAPSIARSSIFDRSKPAITFREKSKPGMNRSEVAPKAKVLQIGKTVELSKQKSRIETFTKPTSLNKRRESYPLNRGEFVARLKSVNERQRIKVLGEVVPTSRKRNEPLVKLARIDSKTYSSPKAVRSEGRYRTWEMPKPSGVPESRPQIRPLAIPRVETRGVPQRKVERKEQNTKPTFEELAARHIKYEPNSRYADQIRDVIKNAGRVVKLHMEVEGLTEEQAQAKVINSLAKHYQGKEGVATKLMVMAEAQAKVAPLVNKEVLEVQEKKEEDEEMTKRKKGKAGIKEMVDRAYLYFQKDTRTNSSRAQMILEAIKRRLYSSPSTTGAEIAQEVGGSIKDTKMVSELAKPISRDGGVDGLIKAISGYGVIDNEQEAQKAVEEEVEVHTAVKLTSDPSQNTASGLQAERVYDSILYKVPAYFGEDGSYGTLTAKSDTNELIYIRGKQQRQSMQPQGHR